MSTKLFLFRLSSVSLLQHQFSAFDQKEKIQGKLQLLSWILLIKKLVPSQLNAHGWGFFGTTMKWPRFFKCNTKVAATSFSHEEGGSFHIFSSYYTSFSLPWKSTLHNSASDFTTHSLNAFDNMDNSTLIHVLVGQEYKLLLDISILDTVEDAIHSM